MAEKYCCKLSIITVCKNAAQDIERTIQSVLDQTYDNIEYIIIDGASEDGTMDVVNRYKEHADIVVSEPDDGIYNAMNKGIDLSHGEILYFLNAGDYLIHKKVIANIIDIFNQRDCDVIHGNILIIDRQTDRYSIKRGTPQPDDYYFYNRSLPHQAMFYRGKVFERVGGYDESFRVISDNVLNLKVFRDGALRKHYEDMIAAVFFSGGIGSREKEIHADEKAIFRNKFFSDGMKKRFVATTARQKRHERIRRWIRKVEAFFSAGQ